MKPAATANTPGHYSHRAAQTAGVHSGVSHTRLAPASFFRKWHAHVAKRLDGAVEIATKDGRVIVDADIVDSHYDWSLDVKRGRVYFSRRESGKTIRKSVPRVALGSPNADVIDHINGDTLDNRRINLRKCTKRENAWNASKRKGACHSIYKGVCWDRGKWVAYICKDGKQTRLGRFALEEEAARAYDERARELFGEYAALNFPVVGEQAALRESVKSKFPAWEPLYSTARNVPPEHAQGGPADTIAAGPFGGGLVSSAVSNAGLRLHAQGDS